MENTDFPTKQSSQRSKKPNFNFPARFQSSEEPRRSKKNQNSNAFSRSTSIETNAPETSRKNSQTNPPNRENPSKNLQETDWTCPACSYSNFGRNKLCRQCKYYPTPKSAQNPKKPLQFSRFLCKKPFKNQHQMRRFVAAALTAEDKTKVLQLLAESKEQASGRERLCELLQCDYSLSAGSTANLYSWQRIAVPLCHFLTDSEVRHSIAAKACKIVYSTVYNEVLFIERYVDILEQISHSPYLLTADSSTCNDLSAYAPKTFHDVSFPFVSLLNLLLARVTDCDVDPKWFPILGRIQGMLKRYYGEDLGKCMVVLEKCMTIVNRYRKREEKALEEVRRGVMLLDFQLAYEQQTGVIVPLEEQPGPGDLHPNGPRHDNDKASFRDISILPTEEEILCSMDPYLPRQDPQAHSVHFIDDPVERYLDIQFRLTREDMMAPVRYAVQYFLKENILSQMEKRQVIYTAVDATRQVRMCVFRRMRVSGMNTSIRSGVLFEVLFDFDYPKTAKSANSKKTYWETGVGSKFLQYGSLACLIHRTIEQGAVHNTLLFVKVESRVSPDADEASRCSVQVSPLDSSNVISMISTLNAAGAESAQEAENVMIQVKGHFFAGYESILQTLQRIDGAASPILSKITPGMHRGRASPPGFVTPGVTCYDLSILVKKESNGFREAAEELRRVVIEDYERLKVMLHHFEESLLLDHTQIDAFALALTNDIALIQGPPGTGKSYVGIQIVRALLHNSSGRSRSDWVDDEEGIHMRDAEEKPALHPIMCICYTNHALDQFLEGLIESGAVSKTGVVRIGGRSKSAVLGDRNLRNLSMQMKSKQERYVFATTKTRMNDMEHEIEVCSEEIARDRKKLLPQMMTWLSMYYPEEYEEIAGPEDGFTRVGSFETLVRLWMNDRVEAAERKQQVEEWKTEFIEGKREKLKWLIESYSDLVEELRTNEDASRLRCLREASVIGVTTSGCAQYQQVLTALRPQVVLCEEAGEVFESHLISAVHNAQSVILIGDHMQLRPKCSQYSLSVESGNRFDLDVSLFERLVSRSAQNTMESDTFSVCTLNTQRRMRPIIADIMRLTLYPSLEDAPNVLLFPETVRGFRQPLWFFDHQNVESGGKGDPSGGTSYSNEFEAKMVCSLVRYLIRQQYEPSEIAVITPYVGQLLLLRKMLSAAKMKLLFTEKDLETMEEIEEDENLSDGNVEEREVAGSVTLNVSLKERVRIATVDNFQGEEAKVVLISTVRCNSKGRTGFLKISNRVNVMLSRAQHGMYILGSSRTVQKRTNSAKMFSTVLDDFKRKGLVGQECIELVCENHRRPTIVKSPEDVPMDGGCSEICGSRRECGHACRRQCHNDDKQHSVNECPEDCVRRIPACGHACRKICYEKCGGCQVPTIFQFDSCSHALTLPCHRWYAIQKRPEIAAPKCTESIRNYKIPACGHVLSSLPCWRLTRGEVACTLKCGKTLACGHACEHTCASCTESLKTKNEHVGKCSKECERILLCGHICGASPCHQAGKCPPCDKACGNNCEHTQCPLQCKELCYICSEACPWRCACQGPCAYPCGSPCPRLPCDRRCPKVLDCGHQCPSVCGEQCPPNEYCVQCIQLGVRFVNDVSDQVVDLIAFLELKDLDLESESPEDTPILVLECGHALTMESLDGICDINSFYTRDELGWSGVVSLNELGASARNMSCPACPHCKKPFRNIRRYGRIFKWASLRVAALKLQSYADESAQRIQSQINVEFKEINSEKKSLEDFWKRLRRLENEIFNFVKKTTKASPMRVVFERERVFWEKSDLLTEHSTAPQLVEMAQKAAVTAMETAIGFWSFKAVAILSVPSVLEKNKAEDRKDTDTSESEINEWNLVSSRVEALLASGVKVCAESELAAGKIYEAYANFLWFSFEGFGGLIGKGVKEMRESLIDKLSGVLDFLPEEYNAKCAQAQKILSGEPFYDDVSNDEKREIFKAMGLAEHGNFGGHWFTCANGHVYTIGECGGAMETSHCPECDSLIGGGQHRLVNDNRRADSFLSSIGRVAGGGDRWRENGEMFMEHFNLPE